MTPERGLTRCEECGRIIPKPQRVCIDCCLNQQADS